MEADPETVNAHVTAYNVPSVSFTKEALEMVPSTEEIKRLVGRAYNEKLATLLQEQLTEAFGVSPTIDHVRQALRRFVFPNGDAYYCWYDKCILAEIREPGSFIPKFITHNLDGIRYHPDEQRLEVPGRTDKTHP